MTDAIGTNEWDLLVYKIGKIELLRHGPLRSGSDGNALYRDRPKGG